MEDPAFSPPEQPTRAQTAARIALAATLLGLGLWTLREFIPALVWAGIIAIAVWPLYLRARQECPPDRHNLLLPSAFTLVIAVVFIAPLVLAAVRVGRESHAILDWVDAARRSGIPAPNWLAHLPF